MTTQQAQTILARYRPGTSDDRDPEVRAALDLAARDTALARWLKDHQTLQQTLQDRLRNLPPPPGLREQILSERRAAFSLRRFPRRALLAGSGALLLALTGGLIVWRQPHREERFATFRSRMIRAALRGYAMDLSTTDRTAMRSFLNQAPAPDDWQEPPGLARRPLLGCAVLPWQGRSAAMICYGQGPQPDLWLFVARTDMFPDPPEEPASRPLRVNRLNTVSWSAGEKTYVLAGELDPAELLRLAGRGG